MTACDWGDATLMGDAKQLLLLRHLLQLEATSLVALKKEMFTVCVNRRQRILPGVNAWVSGAGH
jgi:hypothetical protein